MHVKKQCLWVTKNVTCIYTNQMISPAHSSVFLEAVLHNIGIGIVVINQDGACIMSNPAAAQLLGDIVSTSSLKMAELSGFYKADKETPLPAEENPFARAMRGESATKEEIYVQNERRPDGGWYLISINPLVFGDDASQDKGGIIIFEDITQRRFLADEVLRSNRDLQQFAYVAAHDLQEPLRTITGFGELLEQSLVTPENENAKDHLRRILLASRRMQTLISALLSYARIETRAKAPQACDCTSIMQDVVADMDKVIRDKNAVIKITPLPEVMADSAQLSQVFSNLVGNALKYSDQKPVINVSAQSGPYEHTFCFADNGIGIDMAFKDRIFGLFQRLHNKNQYDGVGIGLALCKKIIESHGGKIWIDSADQKGTRVFFTLPKVTKRGLHA